MVFNNNENNYNNNESIFSDPSLKAQEYPQLPVSQEPQLAETLLNFFDQFVNKFIEEPKRKNELKKFQNQAESILSPHEEILKIFYNFGCNLQLSEKYIDVEYPQLNLKGRITIDNNEVEFDDTAKKIMEHLAKLINNTNSMGGILDKYEQDKYYPASDLERKTIILEGKETEVLSGTMMNKQGLTKQVYYYKGKEVTPDGEN